MPSTVATTQSATAVGFAFPIIDGILIALRFYARRTLKTSVQIDDWLCIPAWLCLTGCCASMLTGVFKGAFDEVPWADPVAQEHLLAQVTAALVIFWMGANFLIKLIMLFFYRRIFNVVGRGFNIANWIFVGLSVVWFIYAVLSWLLYCGTNFKADFEGGWASCPGWGFEIQMGVFALDSFIDLGLLIMPIPFVWRLQLDVRRKIAVTIVFLLGGFAFVAGLNNTIIQLVYLTDPSLAKSGGGANFFQGSGLLFSNWPAIEIGVGLLASNLPHLSFRLFKALKESLPHALQLSFTMLRHAAAVLSLNSSRSRHSDRGNTEPSTHPKGQHEAGSEQVLWTDASSARAGASLEQRSAYSTEPVELKEIHVVGKGKGDDAV